MATFGGVDQVRDGVLLYGDDGEHFRPVRVNADGEVVIEKPSLGVGNNRIGTTGINKKIVEYEKLIAAAGDYAAEDVISENAAASMGTPWEFNGVAREIGGSGMITKAMAACSKTGLTWRMTMYLFNARPTSAFRDNEPNTAIIDADRRSYVGKIDFPAMEDLGGDSDTLATPSTVGNIPLSFQCAPETNILYGILVTRDAETAETAGMNMYVQFEIEQD